MRWRVSLAVLVVVIVGAGTLWWGGRSGGRGLDTAGNAVLEAPPVGNAAENRGALSLENAAVEEEIAHAAEALPADSTEPSPDRPQTLEGSPDDRYSRAPDPELVAAILEAARSGDFPELLKRIATARDGQPPGWTPWPELAAAMREAATLDPYPVRAGLALVLQRTFNGEAAWTRATSALAADLLVAEPRTPLDDARVAGNPGTTAYYRFLFGVLAREASTGETLDAALADIARTATAVGLFEALMPVLAARYATATTLREVVQGLALNGPLGEARTRVAMEGLARAGDAATVQALLDSGNAQRQTLAAASAGPLRAHPDVANCLRTLALPPSNPVLALAAARSLAGAPAEVVGELAPFWQAAQNVGADPAWRAACLSVALGAATDPAQAAASLEPLLGDADPTVRTTAARGFARVAPERAADQVEAWLTGSEISDPAAPVMLAELADVAPDVFAERVVSGLWSVAREAPEPRRRQVAIAHLPATRNTDREALRSVAHDDPDPGVRAAAIQRLARALPRERTDDFRAWLRSVERGDPSPLVRNTASRIRLSLPAE